MISKRKMISIDEDLCNGCGECVPSCEEGALAIVDGKAKLVKEIYCDGLGACLGDCPTGALKVEVREAEDFNPDAVAEHLKEQGRSVPDHMPSAESLRIEEGASDGPRPFGGCPGSAVQSLSPCGQANTRIHNADEASALTHWPVQLRLVPPSAPFLKGADLLLTADCVPVAMPSYHSDFLNGRVVVMGCPKFDNQMEYVDKLAAILNESELNSITVMEMEVPCCSSMTAILSEAVKRSGKSVKTNRVTVSRAGKVIADVELHI